MHTINSKKFGKNVTTIRKSKAITQTELASLSGLQRSFISSIEKGNQNVTLETIAKLSVALSIPARDFFGESDFSLNDKVEPKEVSFIKLGGTWDMIETDQGLVGSGKLDDKQLQKIEKELEYDERQLFLRLREDFFSTQPLTQKIPQHLVWSPEIGNYINGNFYPVFSGDSSNYRPSLFSAAINYLFKHLVENPGLQLLVGLGTDTTDILLPLLDVFLFDKKVSPILVTGANRSHREKNSDAPQNIYDTAYATHLNLLPGAYYVFHGSVYRGGDIVKIDPSEEPKSVEGQTTFFAPHRTQTKVGYFSPQKVDNGFDFKNIDSLKMYSSKQLFDKFNAVVSVDLGDNNPIDHEVSKILSEKNEAVIIKSHALGNVPSPIRKAAIEAVKRGKLIINVSRCLIGQINDRYYVSLSSANKRELKNDNNMIINGGKLNQKTAKALMIRALLEKRDQKRTKQLVDKYSERTYSSV